MGLGILPVLFFLVATIYSSVGFGGGSSYLALLVLAGVPYQQIAPLGLICNVMVTLVGTVTYLGAGTLNLRKVFPFVISSVPAAFVGGMIPVGKTLFLFLLGVSLFAAALRLFARDPELQDADVSQTKKTGWRYLALIIGMVFGLLSGLTGIGGGIFLSPFLFLTNWGSSRQIAAAACFFIFVNSLAGLSGQFYKSGFALPGDLAIHLGIVVVVGGILGSQLASSKLSSLAIRRMTAALVLFVSLNVLWRWGHLVGG